MVRASSWNGSASTGVTGDGLLKVASSARTAIRGSSTARRTCSTTPPVLSPGRIRKLTSARAVDGSTFSFTPAWSTVGAVVVRSSAFPWGVVPNRAVRIPPSSQRFAITRRGPNGISGPR
jgi:hypothetical protein